MTDSAKAITETKKSIDAPLQGGFFSISVIANNRVSEKRLRKGLGDMKKRENGVYK